MGGSFFGPWPIRYFNPYAITLLLFAGASTLPLNTSATCEHRRTFKHSAALPWRKAHLSLPIEEPTFCATLVGEIAPLDADFVFLDIRGGHSAPISWMGFHQQVSLPSTFSHPVGEMAPHYFPKRDNNRFGEFPFFLRLVYGRFFYPGYPSCGRLRP